MPGIEWLFHQLRDEMPVFRDIQHLQKEVIDKMNARHAMFQAWLK